MGPRRGLIGVVASRGSQIYKEGDPAASYVQTASRLPGVGHVIGVGAGKGGVGKSTVAVNLAVAMANAGLRVGLVDADIQGPSVPIMMGLADVRPHADEERKIAPLVNHGVRFVSMGNLIGRDDAVVWRGPMVGRAVTQLFDDVRWGELDVLIAWSPARNQPPLPVKSRPHWQAGSPIAERQILGPNATDVGLSVSRWRPGMATARACAATALRCAGSCSGGAVG